LAVVWCIDGGLNSTVTSHFPPTLCFSWHTTNTLFCWIAAVQVVWPDMMGCVCAEVNNIWWLSETLLVRCTSLQYRGACGNRRQMKSAVFSRVLLERLLETVYLWWLGLQKK